MRYENTPPLQFVDGQRVSLFWVRCAKGAQALDTPAWRIKDEEVALAALVDAERAAREAERAIAGLDAKRIKLLRAVAVDTVDEETSAALAGAHRDNTIATAYTP